jgi:hypothetical protein
MRLTVRDRDGIERATDEGAAVISALRWVARHGKGLTYGLIAVLLSIVGCEVAFRIYTALWLPSLTPESIRTQSSPPADADEAAADSTLPAAVLHPFLGWIETPGSHLTSALPAERLSHQLAPDIDADWLTLPVNNAGFVSPYDMPYHRQANDHVVLIVGGSVARFLALQGADRLRDVLQRDPRLRTKDIVIINGASGAYKQPQQAIALAYLISLGLQPDGVINIDGFNEAALTMQNLQEGVAAAFPMSSRWSGLLVSSGTSPRMIQAIADVQWARQRRDAALASAHAWARTSNIIGFLFMKRAQWWDARSSAAYGEYQQAADLEAKRGAELARRGPFVEVSDEQQRTEAVDLWVRGSVVMGAMCRSLGMVYVHILQPTPHDTLPTPSKPLTDEERALVRPPDDPWAQSIRTLYPLMRARAADLGRHGIRFGDLSRILESEPRTIYYDYCHLNQLGNEVFAERIAEQYLAALSK